MGDVVFHLQQLSLEASLCCCNGSMIICPLIATQAGSRIWHAVEIEKGVSILGLADFS